MHAIFSNRGTGSVTSHPPVRSHTISTNLGRSVFYHYMYVHPSRCGKSASWIFSNWWSCCIMGNHGTLLTAVVGELLKTWDSALRAIDRLNITTLPLAPNHLDNEDTRLWMLFTGFNTILSQHLISENGSWTWIHWKWKSDIADGKTLVGQ